MRAGLRLGLGLVLGLLVGVGSLVAQDTRISPEDPRLSPHAPQTMPVLTLEQAVEQALRAHPSVVQAEGAVQTARSAELTALGSYLPSLSLSSGASLASTERFNPQTQTTVSGSNDSYSGGVSAGMELFTAGRRGAELRQARAETDAREAVLVEQRFGVVLQTKTTFFQVLRGEELTRVAEARVTRAQESLDAAQRRLSVGSATRSDVLRAELELANARQALLSARNQALAARYGLGRLVGADGPVGAEAPASLEPAPLPLSGDALEARVLEQAPSIAAAASSLAAARAAERAARTQYFPTLSASAGYDWFNQDPALAGGNTSWGMRVGLSYPLFNRFQRGAAIERADVQARNAQVQLADERRAARAELARVLGDLAVGEQRVELAETAVRVAEEDLRVQQERYRLGASTILELITSQENLVSAQNDLVNARYDYQLALAELEALAGTELRPTNGDG